MKVEELEQYYGKQVWTTYNLQPCLVTLLYPVSPNPELDYYWVKTEETDWLETASNLFIDKEEAKEVALKEIEEKLHKYQRLKEKVKNL